MNSKKRYIPLVIIGAIILSLLAVLPVFSATGRVNFYNVDSPTDAQVWAKQDGSLGIEITDPDLNVPIKYVINTLQSDTAFRGTTAITAGSADFTMTAADAVAATALAAALFKDDTILVGTSGTVRKITSSTATSTMVNITVNEPFEGTLSTQRVYEVIEPTLSYDNCPTCAAMEQIELAANVTFFALNSAPINDSGVGLSATDRGEGSFDTSVNTSDVRLLDSSGALATQALVTVNRENGLSNISPATSSPVFLYAMYWGSAQNQTGDAVTVRSNADSDGFTINLTETGSNTGVFRGELATVGESFDNGDPRDSDAAADPPELKVGSSDTISVIYRDASPRGTRRATISVETTDPTFSDLSPADGASTKLTIVEVGANITDASSGVDASTITIIFARDNGDGTLFESEYQTIEGNAAADIDSIDGGYSVTARKVFSVDQGSDATIYWWVMATDKASNVGVTDHEPELTLADDSKSDDPCEPDDFPDDLEVSGVDVDATGTIAGCQPFSVNIDFSRPNFEGAITGVWWDPALTTTDKSEDSPSKAKNTSIRVDFSEALDGTTIQALDFEVDGSVPLAARHFSGRKQSVFLSVPSLDPNDRPKIELVGEVSDVAGNTAKKDAAEDDFEIPAATDGIGPSLTVTLIGTAGGTRPVTDEEILIGIVANEDISTPVVTISRVKDSDAKDLDLEDVESTLDIDESAIDEGLAAFEVGASPTVRLKAARTYEATFTADNPGLYNVYVTATDSTAGSEGVKGINTGPVDLTSKTTALLFEVDHAVASLVVNPDPEADEDDLDVFETDNADTFVTLDFSGEGSEYADADDLTATTAEANLDSYKQITILEAVLTAPDGTETDITGSLAANSDGNKFLYKAFDLALGEHTVKVRAADQAGNEDETDQEGTINVIAREPYSLELNPGWNLVSIPGEAEDSDINAVMGSHPASTVLTYDPTVPGAWLTAVRTANNGAFEGTLMSMTSARAYWILTDSFEALAVDIPRLNPGAPKPPPTINIVKGWNFVPVQDVSEAREDVSADDYLGSAGLEITRVYSFDTIGNRWVGLDIETEDLEIGKGYWVFANKEGTLAP